MDLAVAAGGPPLASAAHGLTGAALGTTWAVTGGGLLATASMIVLLAACPGFARYQADPPRARQRRASGAASSGLDEAPSR